MRHSIVLAFAAALCVAFAPAARAEKYTTADYVQNGLVAMWDCSTLTAESTSWVNSIGSGSEAFAFKGSLVPSSTGLSFPGTTSDYGVLAKNGTTATFAECKNGTLEVVFQRDSASEDEMTILHAPKADGQLMTTGTNSYFTAAQTGKKMFYSQCGDLRTVSTIATRYSYTESYVFPDLPGFHNGLRSTDIAVLKSFADTVSTTEATIGVNSGSPKTNAFKGTIYAIRLYSRKLTDHEIEANAKVDAARFKNGDADKPSFSDTENEYGYTRAYTIDGTNYVVEVFTNTSSDAIWTVPSGVTNIELLVVGGGGSGGANANTYAHGGGGAGGLIYTNALSVSVGESLDVKVGAGGAAVSSSDGENGQDSSFGEFYKALGGGFGSATYQVSGGDGGSGGAGRNTNPGKAKQPTQTCGGCGFDGGSKSGNARIGSGGGGAGSSGSSTAGSGDTMYYRVGVGGKGLSFDITGETWIYAYGGQSGLGSADSTSTVPGIDGADGYGAGGGGGKCAASGKGGDGVVILRYLKPCTVTFNLLGDKTVQSADYNETSVSITSSGQRVVVPPNTTIIVTATPLSGSTFPQSVAAQGWTFDQEGSIFTNVVATADTTVEIPATTGGSVTYDVSFNEAQHATHVQYVDGEPVSRSKFSPNEVLDVIATPVEHYQYTNYPSGWTSFDGGSLSNRTTITTDTTIKIPEASAIMIPVTVSPTSEVFAVQGTYVITAGVDQIESGATVIEGTEIVVTVTPSVAYEYAAEPSGWTTNDNGTITYVTTAAVGMGTIVVPSPTKKQVKLSVTSYGVSYVMTNLNAEAAVKYGDKVDGDALIEIRATAFPTYVLPAEPGAGWTIVDGTMIATNTAGAGEGAITIPSAVWTPTDGELIENGGFEYFDTNIWFRVAGNTLPSMMTGSWEGAPSTSPFGYLHWGLWYGGAQDPGSTLIQGNPASGSHALAIRGYDDRPNVWTTFRSSTGTKTRNKFRLSFVVKGEEANDANAAKYNVSLQSSDGKETLSEVTGENALSLTWEKVTVEFSGLAADTMYRINFRNGVGDHGICLDDVSLKMVPLPKGMIVFVK